MGLCFPKTGATVSRGGTTASKGSGADLSGGPGPSGPKGGLFNKDPSLPFHGDSDLQEALRPVLFLNIDRSLAFLKSPPLKGQMLVV